MSVVDCHVWTTTATARGHDEVLDRTERRRNARLVDPAARDRHRAAAGLLRRAVAQLTGVAPQAVDVRRDCPDCDEPHGRPTLPGTGLFASVSRSSGLVAVALCTAGPLGVDVEHVASAAPLAATATRWLAPAETLPRPADAARVWCRKESVLKATGTGLRIAPCEVDVGPADRPPRLRAYRGGALTAVMVDLDLPPGFVGAVTVLAHGTLVVRRHRGGDR